MAVPASSGIALLIEEALAQANGSSIITFIIMSSQTIAKLLSAQFVPGLNQGSPCGKKFCFSSVYVGIDIISRRGDGTSYRLVDYYVYFA